jgi:Flp pilus assembly protein CpaB
MRRSPRVLIAWSVAAIVALITTQVVAGDLSSLHKRARSLGPNVNVVIATRDLLLGTTLQPSDVRVVTRPASTVASDTLRDPAVAKGRVLALAPLRDDTVRVRDLVPEDRSGLDGLVPLGRRAIHVILKDGFRPSVGAVVDVLAAFDASSGPGERSATVVASGARVLATDDPADSPNGGGSGVTLLVTEREVADVAYAGSTGTITVALAPPESFQK